ncbi:MAG: hypothetical protein WCS56_00895 [Bacilli bacterium]
MNDVLLEKTQIINLFDFYGVLLTDKQQNYFKDYYFSDLSLGEISANYKVSRNAVYDQIAHAVAILKKYECKLKLYEKSQNMQEIIAKYKSNKNKEVQELIQALENRE